MTIQRIAGLALLGTLLAGCGAAEAELEDAPYVFGESEQGLLTLQDDEFHTSTDGKFEVYGRVMFQKTTTMVYIKEGYLEMSAAGAGSPYSGATDYRFSVRWDYNSTVIWDTGAQTSPDGVKSVSIPVGVALSRKPYVRIQWGKSNDGQPMDSFRIYPGNPG